MEFIISLAKELLLAWRHGGRKLRTLVVLTVLLATVAFLINWSERFAQYGARELDAISSLLGVAAGVIAFVIYAYRRSVEEAQNDQRVERAEKRVQEHPDQPQAAWDLARIKLESYLNRNLSQVKSIFWLTTFVMLVGFFFVGYGTFEAVNGRTELKAALLSTVAGLLVNFIGATFLALYKSTMEQSKEYVSILERINAVGMSVQVLEKIDGRNAELRDMTTADLSKKLLSMYHATEKVRSRNSRKGKSRRAESL